MIKIVSLLLVLAMAVQIVKPIGLPGLRRRGDFWKIAVAALAAFTLTVLLKMHGGLTGG